MKMRKPVTETAERQWACWAAARGAQCPWTDMGLHFGTSLTSRVTLGKSLNLLTLWGLVYKKQGKWNRLGRTLWR